MYLGVTFYGLLFFSSHSTFSFCENLVTVTLLTLDTVEKTTREKVMYEYNYKWKVVNTL